jgi:trimeric autotransporter adhesin
VAIGSATQATGANAIAIGADGGDNYDPGGDNAAGAQAVGLDAMALGTDAYASNSAAIAIGRNARATGGSSTAIGDAARATNTQTFAVGFGSQATGVGATALGVNAIAQGDNSTTFGTAAIATGALGTAIGGGANVAGVGSIALGANSLVFGDAPNSVVIGRNAQAYGGGNAVALGQGAIAANAGSTAIGAGAQTTMANQIRLGAVGTRVSIADMAASDAAQTGTEYIVTIDANGTLGTRPGSALSVGVVAEQVAQASAGLSQVAKDMVTLQTSLAVSDQQIVDLQNGMATLNSRVGQVSRESNGGTAAAMAMGGMMVVPDSTWTLGANVATYRGERGFAAGLVGRASQRLYISAGVAGSSVPGSTGARVGMAIGF